MQCNNSKIFITDTVLSLITHAPESRDSKVTWHHNKIYNMLRSLSLEYIRRMPASFLSFVQQLVLQYLQHSFLKLNMVTRRGTHHSCPAPPPTCDNCGTQGHISTFSPRSTYFPYVPPLACTQCIQSVRSGRINELAYTEIVQWTLIYVHLMHVPWSSLKAFYI